VLLGDEVSNLVVVDEVLFVLARGFLLGRFSSREQGLPVVEPEFRHTIVIRSAFVTGDGPTVALHQLAESRDSSADGAVDIFPVTKEFIVRQAHPLGDAINEFEHSPLSRAIGFL